MANNAEPSYVIACAADFLALCPILVVLRFYSRMKQHTVLGIDDWLTLPALVSTSTSMLKLKLTMLS